MKKIIMIIIGLVLLVALGVGAFIYFSDDDESESNQNQETSEQSNDSPTSINSLLAQNQNKKCSYSYSDGEGGDSTGTLYVAGKRAFGEFTTQSSAGAQQKTYMLMNAEHQFIWNEGDDTGVRIKISSIKTQDTEDGNEQSIDPDQEYDFECSDWQVDTSKFEVPEDIDFTEISSQVQKGIQQQAEQACAKLESESAREACENTLN